MNVEIAITAIEHRRFGPVIRAMQRQTDPLFRQAGLNLHHFAVWLLSLEPRRSD
jgi:hypothetical protein